MFDAFAKMNSGVLLSHWAKVVISAMTVFWLLAGSLGASVLEDILPEKANRSWTATVYWENDIFARTDSNYTNGAKLSWTSPDLMEYRDAEVLPNWVYRALEALPLVNERGIQRNLGISIGQNMYTPQDIGTPDLQVNDRPYAGWLYLGVGLHNKTERFLDTLEVNLGVVGKASLAESTQKWVHRVKGAIRPEGWHHQLKNEPVLNFIFERKYRAFKLGDESGWGMDGFIHAGASLGTVYTYGNAGGSLRVGWNLPVDFGTAIIRLAGDTNAPASRKDVRLNGSRFGFHLFTGYDGRFVIRDMFLDGNLFAESHSVDKEQLVGDFHAGFSLLYGSWKMTYAQVLRTREFEQQERAHHAFGSMSLSYTY